LGGGGGKKGILEKRIRQAAKQTASTQEKKKMVRHPWEMSPGRRIQVETRRQKAHKTRGGEKSKPPGHVSGTAKKVVSVERSTLTWIPP